MEQVSCVTDQSRVIDRMVSLYEEAFEHEGFAEIRIEIRILRRGQKEVILHCGKQYRFIVDAKETSLVRRIRALLAQEVTLSGLKAPRAN
ncbi:MAG: hypothetical protein ACK4F8_08120 [Aquabacterium sp.]